MPSNGLIRNLLSWLGRHELGFLVSVAVIAAGLWGFVALADEVISGGTAGIDRRILLSMRNPANLADPIGPPVVEEAARDITALGGITVLGLLTLSVSGFLFLEGKPSMAWFVLTAVVTGLIASNLLKLLYNRPRPELVPHLVYAIHTSFPSGHSMLSAVTYLTLGALLARSQTRRRLKAYFILLAVLITIAVGISRVYLGVHWPTDVLAGWTAGAIWALLCHMTATRLQQTHTIEQEQEHNAT